MNFSRKKNGRRSGAAFTLIEIMVAIMIFSMVVAAIYSTLLLIIRATHVGQAAAARAQRERVAIRTIESSLTCIQSSQVSQKYYSFDLVNDGDNSTLSFVARTPENFPRNGKFGRFNLRRLTFSLETDRGGEKDLVLRQNPILMDMDEDEQQNPLVLEKNVKQFSVECWDTNQEEWVSEWDNTNLIPPMVLVELDLSTSGDDRSAFKDDSDLTLIRVISPPSSAMPKAVQMGAGGGAPPPAPTPTPIPPAGNPTPPR